MADDIKERGGGQGRRKEEREEEEEERRGGERGEEGGEERNTGFEGATSSSMISLAGSATVKIEPEVDD